MTGCWRCHHLPFRSAPSAPSSRTCSRMAWPAVGPNDETRGGGCSSARAWPSTRAITPSQYLLPEGPEVAPWCGRSARSAVACAKMDHVLVEVHRPKWTMYCWKYIGQSGSCTDLLWHPGDVPGAPAGGAEVTDAGWYPIGPLRQRPRLLQVAQPAVGPGGHGGPRGCQIVDVDARHLL